VRSVVGGARLKELKTMPELSKLTQQTVDLTSAYDDRKRLFDRLRDLKMNDEARAEALKLYETAAKHFDKLRSTIVKN
jgi:hypothetical protein